MAGVYAPDGSLRVTLVDDGPPVTVSDTSPGVYAHDGSYRVTIVGIASTGGGAVVSDSDSLQIPVTGTYVDTVTFTVSGNEVTALVLS